jgi:pimeloyl-ACP methyl ester carboxylesterase
MGGMIAGLVAGELPHLVRALVLIDPGGIETPRESEFWTAWRNGENLLLPQSRADWDRMVAILYQRKPHIPEFLVRTALRSIATRREEYQRIFTALLSDGFNPLGERLGRISCPVTVVWGAQDRVMDPSGVEVIRRALPDATTYLLPNCGHSPTREQPGALTDILFKVMNRYG